LEQQLPPKPTQEELEEQIDLFSERLADLDEDAFGYKDKAKKVAESLIQNKPPFVYAICGEWGSGKSTFLRYLLEYLPKPEENGVVIYFNAWRESLHKDVMMAFVHRMIEQLVATIISEDKEVVNKDKLIEGFKVLKKSAYNFFSSNLIAKLVGTANPLLGLCIGLLSNMVKSSNENLQKANEGENGYKEILEKEREFITQYENLSDLLSNNDINIYVIIDELDRCSPPVAVRMIESLRMFFTGPDELQCLCYKRNGIDANFPKIPFKYILAFDKDFITSAFSAEYQFGASTEGERYLEKFIRS